MGEVAFFNTQSVTRSFDEAGISGTINNHAGDDTLNAFTGMDAPMGDYFNFYNYSGVTTVGSDMLG